MGGWEFRKFYRRLQRDRRFPSKGDNNNNVDQIINKTALGCGGSVVGWAGRLPGSLGCRR